MRAHLTPFAIVLGVFVMSDSRAAAQALPEFPGAIYAPDRRGTPVETLETVTGERVREGGGRQERGEMETDRDSYTPATTIVGRGLFILESAYSFIDNRGVKETHSFPETVLRYGLTDRIELRLGWNADIGGTGNNISGAGNGSQEDATSGGRIEREYKLSYGVKLRVTDQDGWMPRSVVMVQGFTPTGGSEGTSTATRLVALYGAGWVLPNRWTLDSAMRYGYASEEGDHFNEWSPSVVLRVPITEKWAMHVEYFGIFTSGKEQNSTQHYVSTGVRYLVTSNLELGTRVGWGLNDQSSRFFVNAGFGWRF